MPTTPINTPFNNVQQNYNFVQQKAAPAVNPAINPFSKNTTNLTSSQTKQDPVLRFSPTKLGLVNAGAWGFVAYLCDRFAFSKLFGSEPNNKISIGMGAAVGLFMGIHSYKQAKKFQKENASINTNA